MFNSVYLQKSWLEDRLNNFPKYNTGDAAIDKMMYDSSMNISSMDGSKPENEYSYGNIFFHGDIKKTGTDTRKEIEVIKEIFDLQRFLKENNSFDTWSTYYTKDYIMIYPFGSAAENIKEESDLFSAVKQSINQLNIETNNEVFEKGWETEIFFDHTGQILMFSKNLPVLKNEEVDGIIAVNISVEDVGNYIQDSGGLEVYITDSVNNLVYSNGSEIKEIQQLKELFKQNYNLTDIEGILMSDAVLGAQCHHNPPGDGCHGEKCSQAYRNCT